MKLYLIKQDSNCGYDTYDSAVVIAHQKKKRDEFIQARITLQLTVCGTNGTK